jgi:UDP-glucose 6-dehydrogenase
VQQEQTLVVGVGEVGGALAEVLERVSPVLRQDLEPITISGPVGVMHICIPYQSGEQFEGAAVSYINKFRPRLTIVNSTVVPGTVRSIACNSGAPVAYSPVRGKHARMTQELLEYTKFIAAFDDNAAMEAEAHFQRAGMRTRRIAQVETLELAKLVETTYFGVQIAFAQEVNRLAEKVGANYDEAISFFEEIGFLPRTRYFPGFIGGHCVIPNINLLRNVAISPLFEAVLASNELRAKELAQEQFSADKKEGSHTEKSASSGTKASRTSTRRSSRASAAPEGTH